MWTRSRYFPCCFEPGSFTAEGVDVKNAYIESTNSTCTRSICIKVGCAGGAGGISAVKDLGIYLQSSQILELRQYNITFQTEVRAG